MIVEILRWVSIAILWACVGLQGWLLIINNRLRKRLRGMLTRTEDMYEYMRCVINNVRVWVIANHPDEYEDLMRYTELESIDEIDK